MVFLSWSDFKSIAVNKVKVRKVDRDTFYHLTYTDVGGDFETTILKDSGSDQTDFESNYDSYTNKSADSPTLPDNRALSASNRIPLGYTIFPTGQGDNISAATYGNGPALKVTPGAPTVEFQMLHHWYGLGGRLIWENATMADRLDAWLIAPATTGFTQATGDFNRVAIPNTGDTLHLYVPAAPGTGAWSADLTAKIGSSQVLQATPVPVAGNTGYFDYDSDTSIVTPNYTGTGGHNLYNFEIKLFKFAHAIWGRKQDGAESVLESTDVVGKLLYNQWKIRFTLTPGSEQSTATAGVVITTATKKNL
jgi:hypothetical protein